MPGTVSYLTFASLLGSAECAVIAVIFFKVIPLRKVFEVEDLIKIIYLRDTDGEKLTPTRAGEAESSKRCVEFFL